MKEILVHVGFGGFEISIKCATEFLKRKFGLEVTTVSEHQLWVEAGGDKYYIYHDFDKYRDDPILIQVVKEFGEYDPLDDRYDDGMVIETYDDESYSYRINTYDGSETLILEPLIREDKIKELHHDFNKLMDYIKSTGVAVKPI